MRLAPCLLLALVACTKPRDGTAPPAASAAEPAPPETLPARAASVVNEVQPITWPHMKISEQLSKDLTDCSRPGTCPKTDEGKARRKAERTFACAKDEVDVALRKEGTLGNVLVFGIPIAQEAISLPESERAVLLSTNRTIPDGDSMESLLVRRGTAAVFKVVGCDHWGVVVCVTGNRSIRTPSATYENTSDRVCLWGWAQEQPPTPPFTYDFPLAHVTRR
jgi:hypothetical protein